MEKFKILKDLVKFNTIQDKQNNEIINYIENYLINIGFKTEYKTKDLVMSIGRNQKLGFLGHTDTVEYIEEFKNPFQLIEKGENLYGLGVCDMKSGISAILEAVSTVDFKKLNSGIKLYFTYDEEIKFNGTLELVNRKEKFPEYMIFGEPTDNEVYTGGKGLLEFKIIFKGKKVHSSNPEKGISANLNAVNFLYDLNTFYNEEIKICTDNSYEIPYTTMNVGLINGGSAINSVPAMCIVMMDFRIINTNHINALKNKIFDLAKIYYADIEIITLVEPFINKIDLINEVKTLNYITEASFINNSKRIVLGAGPITAHEVDEHISKKSYEKLVNQYKDLINKICL